MARGPADGQLDHRAWPHRFGLVAVWLFPVVFLSVASGAALVASILSRSTLAVALPITVALGIAGSAWSLRRAPGPVRRALVGRVRAGVVAGLLGTAAYDLVRYAVVQVFGLSFRPFHALHVFGQLLVGEDASPTAIAIAGIAFHVTNGTTFGIAHALLFGRPSIPTGLAWAVILECFMITLYPGWLNVSRVDELALVSILGHIAYGITLGLLTPRLMATPASRSLRSAPVRIPAGPPRDRHE